MVRQRYQVAGVAALLVFVCTPAARADFAHLTLQSEPGDFIGQGMNFDVTYNSPSPSTIFAEIRKRLPDGSPAELLFIVSGGTGDGSNTFSTLFFGTDQLGIPIQPGTYTDAQRADFASPGHPGLDVSWQNRGSNTLTGNFTISDVTFFMDATGTLQIGTFSASFEQHSEGAPPALFGTFDYQNAGAPAAPEPASVVLLGMGAVGLIAYSRRRKTAKCKMP